MLRINPRPKKCGLQRVDFETESREKTELTLVPDKSSEEYRNNVKRFKGTFIQNLYDGEWLEEPVTTTTELRIGKFTCRRLEREGFTQPTIERTVGYAYDPEISRDLYKEVKALGWCATCPYFGMSTAEADRYDAAANEAEAARLRGELHLSEARLDLKEHLRSQGIIPDTTGDAS